MRFSKLLLITTFALTACDFADSTAPKGPVDANNLPPLTSKEQSLIYGADGAAAQGNTAAAERDYMNAVAVSTGHVEAHLALAHLYEKQNQPEKEADVLDRALAFQPGNALANYMRGKLYLDGYHYTEARDAFDRGLKQRPDDLDLNTGKGVAEDMLGNHTAAQAIYLRTIQVNPKGDLTTLKTNLAMSYLLGGAPQKAVDLLQPEVRKPGASSVTKQNLALAYGLLGRNADAKKLLNGEIDEETRTLAVARMREYVKDHKYGQGTPLTPGITPAPSPLDASDTPAKKKVAAPSMKTDHSPMAKSIAADEKKKAAAAKAAADAKDQ